MMTHAYLDRTQSLMFTTVACFGLLTWPAGVSAADTPQGTPSHENKASSEPMLEAIGTLAASQLYQTYLNIGFLADEVADGTTQEKDARPILASVIAALDRSDKQLESVGKLSLAAGDRQSITQL